MTSGRGLIALAEKKVLEQSFRLFVRDAWEHVDGDEFIHGWHVDVICDHLQAISEGRCQRLLVNMPPGLAKSTILSVLWPAWVWTFEPSHRFLSTSYSLELSQTHSRQMRQLVLSDWYQARWPVKLKADQNEKTNFENVHGGTRKIRAFTSLTGARGDTVIVDDPHSMDAAWSEQERKSTVQTFKASVPSRLHSRKHGRIAVVMQRFHDEDVSGFILDNPELNYTHLCMPHEFEGDKTPNGLGWVDPRTEVGELLFPAFFPLHKVIEEKASLGPADWAGQHQQRPVPREAGELDTSLFEPHRFDRYITGIDGNPVQNWPKGCNYYMTSDHAVTTHGDFNVFRIWAYDSKKHLWLVDSFRKQCLFHEALGVEVVDGKVMVAPTGALAMVKKWKPLRFYPEDDNNFKAMHGMLLEAMASTGTYVRIEKQTPHGKNKIAKVQGYINLAFQGRIHLPKGKIGDEALEEYQRFPNGRHDDQVDADGMIGRVIDDLYPGYDPSVEEALFAYGYAEEHRSPWGDDKTDASTFFI
jgi:phage terminase large subunit-like protein